MNNGKEKTQKLTTASGRPYVENENTQSVGPRGPLLLQDYILHEKMAHFNRERIPERVVHAKEAPLLMAHLPLRTISPDTQKPKCSAKLESKLKPFFASPR